MYRYNLHNVKENKHKARYWRTKFCVKLAFDCDKTACNLNGEPGTSISWFAVAALNQGGMETKSL